MTFTVPGLEIEGKSVSCIVGNFTVCTSHLSLIAGGFKVPR